jgi:hypothetical protein
MVATHIAYPCVWNSQGVFLAKWKRGRQGIKKPRKAGPMVKITLKYYSALTLPLLFAITSSAMLFGAGE